MDRKRKLDDEVTENLSLSCNTCKQRKVRCDKVHPACGWCAKNGSECVYTEKRKPGLKPGFGRELIDRLEKLEAVVAGNAHAIDWIQSELRTKSTPIPIVKAPTPDTMKPSPLHQADQAVQADRVDDIDDIDQTQTNGLPPRDMQMRLAQLYFEHVNSWFPVLDAQDAWARLFSSPAVPVLMHAIVAVSLRFLPEDAVPADAGRRFHTSAAQKITLLALETPTIESLEAMVVFAVDVVGTSNGPKCWALLSMICSIALKLGLNTDNPRSGTMTPSADPSPISTAGVPIIPASVDAANDERRRRLFWGAYVLDRFATVGSSFAFNIPSGEVLRRLPSADPLADLHVSHWLASRPAGPSIPGPAADDDARIEPFSCQIELLGIFSSVHEFLRRPFNIHSAYEVDKWQLEYRKMCLVLDEWHLSLPAEYATTDKVTARFETHAGTDPLWLMLHSLYHTVVIRINSSAGYPYQQSGKFVASVPARDRCLDAVANIVELTKVVAHRPDAFQKYLGPHYAFTLWVAARLSIVHAFTAKTMLPDSIAALVRALGVVARHWPVARRYSDLLLYVIEEGWLRKMRKRNWADAIAATAEPGEFDDYDDDDDEEKARMQSAKILSDMRRTASDLDFLLSMSRQERESRSRRRHALPASPTVLDDGSTASFSPAHEFDMVNIFEWFNWPKTDSAADTFAAAGFDFSSWSFLPDEPSSS